MIIPVVCMSCGKVIANRWEYYEAECKKLEEEEKKEEVDKPPKSKHFDKLRRGELLDEIGLTKMCCRRMFLGQTDVMKNM